jgi:uncharacterized membrane protein YhiD involved in acid resistance
MSLRDAIRRRAFICILALALCTPGTPTLVAQQPDGSVLNQTPLQEPEAARDALAALVRLPLAGLLGAALALRPKRPGTPPRTPAVVQTQIMLAIVGAVVMLVVGASLARAFGIVGVANLIRYRTKIDDPKDAVVMLCALAVGLASGVGLYAIAGFSTIFIGGVLWVVESFEPKSLKRFEVTVKAGDDTDTLRPKIEAILGRFGVGFELRTSSDAAVCYDVQVPLEVQTDRVSNAILSLDPDGHAAVEWAETKTK